MTEHNSPAPFLHPDERALMVRLIDTIAALAQRMEARLPNGLRQSHWQKAKSTPAPWQALYWEHINPTADCPVLLDAAELEALSLRATLANISAQLHTVWEQVEASSGPAPDLSLKKQKRIEH